VIFSEAVIDEDVLQAPGLQGFSVLLCVYREKWGWRFQGFVHADITTLRGDPETMLLNQVVHANHSSTLAACLLHESNEQSFTAPPIAKKEEPPRSEDRGDIFLRLGFHW